MSVNVMEKNESQISNSTKQLKYKMEMLKEAFKKYDKNLDDFIDYTELLSFLDSLMKTGEKFDRNIAKDIFKILDLNGDKKVTVEEFLKTFIGIYDTIDLQIKAFETQLIEEENKKRECKSLIRNFINEPINEEQLSPNSKFLLEITNIEFIQQFTKFEGIRILVRFNDQVKFTNIISINGPLLWKEKFELWE